MESTICEIEAKFSYQKSYNPEDGYTINICEMNGSKVTIKGYFLPSENRLLYKYTGTWVESIKYGKQFKAETFKEEIKNDRESICEYLSCGVIKGIGIKTAINIYDMFGTNTLNILDKEPDELLKVKGITKGKLEKITISYQENKYMKAVLELLLPYDIPAKQCFKIYDKFKMNSTKIIKETPYRLLEVSGIGFRTADTIAAAKKLPKDSKERFCACAKYVLQKNEANGNTCIEENAFGFKMKKALNTPLLNGKRINERTIDMIREKKLIYKKIIKNVNGMNVKKGYIFLPTTYNVECEIAQEICRIKNEPIEIIENVDRLIADAERDLRIKLDDEQKKAVKESLISSICVITGGPGTGKTTIIRVIAYIYKKVYPMYPLIFLAPTGKAARRIKESTGYRSSTVHSFLHIREEGISEEDEEEIYNSLVGCDEFSMMDIWVTLKLVKAVREGNRLILIGDANQLPSVGAGAVLRDVINSNAVKVIRLKKLYRQNANSKIKSNCEKISLGRTDIEEGSDFHIYEVTDLEKIQNLMVENYIKSVNKYGIQNVMCLCPYKKYKAGVFEMNTEIQNRINPHKNGELEVKKNGMYFRENDIVMQLKNENVVSNGDVGIIRHISNTNDALEVYVEFYNDETVKYKSDDLDKLTLAYAITIHKSQGSEVAKVITCLTKDHITMIKRNLPYTDFSRAVEEVDFYGSREALEEAIRNDDTEKRDTILWYSLKVNDGQTVLIA